MAIDTAVKRHSAMVVFVPIYLRNPLPDGTVGQADRQTLALFYCGILITGTPSGSGRRHARVIPRMAIRYAPRIRGL